MKKLNYKNIFAVLFLSFFFHASAIAQDGGETEVLVGVTGQNGETVSRHSADGVARTDGGQTVTAPTPVDPAAGQAAAPQGAPSKDGETKKGQDTTKLTEDTKKQEQDQVKKKQEADARAQAARAAAAGATSATPADLAAAQAAQAQSQAEIEHSKQARPLFSQAIEKDALPQYQQRSGHFNYMSDTSGRRGQVDTTKNIQKEIDEANAEINRLTQEIANEGLGIAGRVSNQQNAQTQTKQMYLAAIEKRRRLIGEIYENAREIAVTTDYNRRVLNSLGETQNQYEQYINSLTPSQRQQVLSGSTVVLGGNDVNVREYFGVNTAAEVPQAIAANREFQERGLRIADGYMQTLQREAQGYQVQVERVLAPMAGISGTNAQNLGSATGGASGVNAGDISKLLGTMQGMGGKGGSSGSAGGLGSASTLNGLDGAKGGSALNPYFGKGGSADPFAKSNTNGQSKSPFGTSGGASGSSSLKSALQAGLASRASAAASRAGASSAGGGAAGASLSAGSLKGGGGTAKNTSGIRGAENAVAIGELDARSRQAALAANGATSVSETQQDVQNMQNAMLSMLSPEKAEEVQRNPASTTEQTTPLGSIDEPLFNRVRQSISRSIEKGNLFNGLDKKMGG